MKRSYVKSKDLDSVNEARKKIGKEPLDKEPRDYKSYLTGAEKRRYNSELERLKFDR